MNIKVLALVNGQEIIGQVTFSNGTYTVKEFAMVALVPSREQGKMGYAIMPWMPYAEDDKVNISASHVLTEVTPRVDLINYYNQLFGSGIQIASAGMLQ